MPSEPPERDLFELALRLGPASDAPLSRTVNPQPVSYQEGHTEGFWVSNLGGVAGGHTVPATLRVVSEHAYWYVDDTLDLPIDDLRVAAEIFDNQIYPSMIRYVGDIWNPGVDNDPRLTVLHTPLGPVNGYYGSRDEFPRQVHPLSNQREMIYLDGARLNPGSRLYLAVLAHELQHAVHWNLDSGEDSWVNEGMSEVAAELAGYPASFVRAFLTNPGTQLNYWAGLGRSGPHYGAATLFLSYLASHYGGYEGLKHLVREQADGINGVEAYVARYGKTFEEVFKDWVLANYLDEDEGPLGYPDRGVRVRDVELMFVHGEVQGRLPQFSASYVDLRLGEGDALVSFEGNPVVSQVGTRCHSGFHCWWGNRGDNIDSTLTREFDLTGLDVATLEFWTWFQLEVNWDYVYIEASADGGATWTVLEGLHTTSEDPVGNNFGAGFTGFSRNWLQESVDLTPYVGGKALVRFEYITDDGVYLDGFLIDDIAIPEIGFFDDADQDMGWQADGFMRIDPVLEQHYAVQIIEKGADGEVSVREIELNEERSGQTVIEGLGSRLENAIIVVSPVTRGTHHPARYRLVVGPGPGE